MKFISLDRAYKVATKSHGTVELPANTFEVPQVESYEEAVEFAGSDAAVLDVFNSAVSSSAKNNGIAIIRNGGEGTKIDDLIAKAIDYMKTFDFKREGGASKKAILEGVDSIRDLKQQGKLAEMSQADLIALLESTLKI